VRLRERHGLHVLRSGTLGALALLGVLLGAAGCASLPAVTGAPIADVGAIVGAWAGTATPGDRPFALTINPGGTLVATWGDERRWGTVTVRDGRATYEMQPGDYEGTIRLFDDGGPRRLVLEGAGAAQYAHAVPVRVASR
jgi:hypothetical protein